MLGCDVSAQGALSLWVDFQGPTFDFLQNQTNKKKKKKQERRNFLGKCYWGGGKALFPLLLKRFFFAFSFPYPPSQR